MTMPTSRSPENPLQAAILARLRGYAPLVAKLAPAKGVTPSVAAVVDEVREGQAFPYVVIGEHTSTPDNDLRAFGRQVTETIHVWTRTQSFAPGQAIADDVVTLLDHQPAALSALLAAAGHRVVSIRHEFAQALKDPDPAIRHHVVRFRVVTAQTA